MKQIVVEIDEGIYRRMGTEGVSIPEAEKIYDAILKGTILPKGHGRLIDADKINMHNISPCDDEMLAVYGATVEDIEEAPTILEAEGADYD